MNLRENIKASLLDARKSKNLTRTSVLSTVVSEIERQEKQQKTPTVFDDAKVQSVVEGYRKSLDKNTGLYADGITKYQENIASYTDEDQIAFARAEILHIEEKATSNAEEVAILDEFLPKRLTDAELTEAIDTVIASGANNVGAVMKELRATGASFDGKAASVIIKDKLA